MGNETLTRVASLVLLAAKQAATAVRRSHAVIRVAKGMKARWSSSELACRPTLSG